MSLDYPFYEELRRRGSPAARIWLIGDRLYYVGLLGGPLAALVALAGAWSSSALSRLGLCVLSLLAGGAIFIAGACLKQASYRIAKDDGLDPDDYD